MPHSLWWGGGRLSGRSRGRPGGGGRAASDRDGGGGFGGFGGFGRGGQDYASPILADGKVFVPTRSGTVHVFKAGPKFESLAQNKFAGDEGPFNASPAASGGELFIRSDKFLYCIAAPEK